MEWTFTHFIVLLFLSAGVIQDLQARRISNSLSAVALFTCLFFAIYLSPSFSGIGLTLSALAIATFLALTLFGLGVWGGGDAKLMIAVSPLFAPHDVVAFFIHSFVWAAIFGLAMALTHGRLSAMANNLGGLFLHRTAPPSKHLTRIPFTIGMFFGYLALLTSHAAGHFL